MDKREREGGVSRFTVQTFLSHSAKNSLAEPFCAMFAKIPGSEKVLDKGGGGGVSRFSVENFLSHSAENAVGVSFSLSLFPDLENFYA